MKGSTCEPWGTPQWYCIQCISIIYLDMDHALKLQRILKTYSYFPPVEPGQRKMHCLIFFALLITYLKYVHFNSHIHSTNAQWNVFYACSQKVITQHTKYNTFFNLIIYLLWASEKYILNILMQHKNTTLNIFLYILIIKTTCFYCDHVVSSKQISWNFFWQ